jgi:hypothetical protein
MNKNPAKIRNNGVNTLILPLIWLKNHNKRETDRADALNRLKTERRKGQAGGRDRYT